MAYTTVNPNLTIGQIAATYPATVNVFLDYDLDFCCGGNRKLSEVCDDSGFAAEELLDRLGAALEKSGALPTASWMERPPLELIDHIIETYHEPLRAQLPQIMILAQRVENAHGESHGPSLTTLRETADELRKDLLEHLDDEEQRLFPLIRSGLTDQIPETVVQLQEDHRNVAKVLESIRELTSNFTLPEYACNTWRALWWNLQSLEKELKEHIHLENNVLFPRVL